MIYTVLCETLETQTLMYTYTNKQMLIRQKHTGEPSFGQTWLQGVKGKKTFTGGERVPGPGPEPTA